MFESLTFESLLPTSRDQKEYIVLNPENGEVYSYANDFGGAVPARVWERKDLTIGVLPVGCALDQEDIETLVNTDIGKLQMIARIWQGDSGDNGEKWRAWEYAQEIYETWIEAADRMPTYWTADEWFSSVLVSAEDILKFSSVKEWAENEMERVDNEFRLDLEDLIRFGESILEEEN